MNQGIVSAVFGARCEVLDRGRRVSCLLRGRLRSGQTAPLAVGDRVEYALVDGGGVIERILPRERALTRAERDRSRRRAAGAPQVIVANPDQVVCVVAAREPGIDFELLDRALALARGADLAALVAVNKMDLAPVEALEPLLAPYRRAAYPVLFISAATGVGLDALRGHLAGQLSLLWGPSGVGKSTLIHALTGVDLRTGQWRTQNPRGPHTTNAIRLFPLPEGGLLADSPGFDWLPLDTLRDEPSPELTLLPEAARYARLCRFIGCHHRTEPGCAVAAAVLAGEIDAGRYARFRLLADEGEPATPPLAEVICDGDDLLFRMPDREVNRWATLRLHFLFEEDHPETAGLCEALGFPPGDTPPVWVLFQTDPAGSRLRLLAKATCAEPLPDVVAPHTEVFIRRAGGICGRAHLAAVRAYPQVWKLRKALRRTALYDPRAFWTDLKPPGDATPGPVHGGLLVFSEVQKFGPLPDLGLGLLSRHAGVWRLDCLEVGHSEDKLAR
ncbi:MAG: ribosome small subunit-dependent GTPase A [Armatimonadetes bacterium]|nr:ribosome small subunit-dependent GTPase A [Armatimonadota bacterium]